MKKTNTVLPYLSITLEHVEEGAQFCLFPNTADENVKLKPALESLQTILSDISEDSTVCELSKNDQGFTSLSITEQYYSRMCDLIEGYFQENDLLSISPKLDMSASKEAYTLTAEDLLSVPVQPYVSYEHCVAAFNQATEGSIFSNIILDIRNTIEAEGALKEDISLIKGVNPQYLAH